MELLGDIVHVFLSSLPIYVIHPLVISFTWSTKSMSARSVGWILFAPKCNQWSPHLNWWCWFVSHPVIWTGNIKCDQCKNKKKLPLFPGLSLCLKLYSVCIIFYFLTWFLPFPRNQYWRSHFKRHNWRSLVCSENWSLVPTCLKLRYNEGN